MGLYLREHERDEANERLHVTLARLRTKTITKTKKHSSATGTYAPYKFCRTFGARYNLLALYVESGGLHPRLYSRGPSARCLTGNGGAHNYSVILYSLNREVKETKLERKTLLHSVCSARYYNTWLIALFYAVGMVSFKVVEG